jgi:hypothetical protein
VASKRRERRRSCESKIRYETLESALAARWGTNRRLNERLGAYRCAFGDHFHLGHNPARVRQAIADRRRNAP